VVRCILGHKLYFYSSQEVVQSARTTLNKVEVTSLNIPLSSCVDMSYIYIYFCNMNLHARFVSPTMSPTDVLIGLSQAMVQLNLRERLWL
jgi:hypothetical protein